MSTKKLDGRKVRSLQPATALWRQLDERAAPLAFKARTKPEASRWQTRCRRELNQTVGFQDLKRVDPRPRTIEKVDRGDHVRLKVLIQTAPDISCPVYLLIPKKGKPPFPSVLALNGHGYGVRDIVGLWDTGEERRSPEGYHADFAVALCRRGFAVAAPEISCFGERVTDFSSLDPDQGAPTTCFHTATLASHLGGSALGLRVWDNKRLIDYLQTRSEFETKRLGAMGISGGGMLTFFTTCLERRIKACVVSGYYCTFRASIFGVNHCACNFVPGLAKFGEMHDLVGLIAPRPMLVEAGTHDSIFPIAAVRKSVRRARQVYSVFDRAENVQTDVFEGTHRISGRKAYDFLWDRLAP